MRRKNYYERYFERCLSADPEILAMSKNYWEQKLSEALAMESGHMKFSQVSHSSTMLDMINLAQGNLVLNCPKRIVKKVATNIGYHHLSLYDAFDEAVRSDSHISKELKDAFMAK